MNKRLYLKYIVPPIVLAVIAMTVLSPSGPDEEGPGSKKREIVAQFDKNGDSRLNSTERIAALAFLKEDAANRKGPRRKGPRGRRGQDAPTPTPGPRLSIGSVEPAPDETDLYDLKTLRTLFFEFEEADWKNN